jgi:hypothetical protein
MIQAKKQTNLQLHLDNMKESNLHKDRISTSKLSKHSPEMSIAIFDHHMTIMANGVSKTFPVTGNDAYVQTMIDNIKSCAMSANSRDK